MTNAINNRLIQRLPFVNTKVDTQHDLHGRATGFIDVEEGGPCIIVKEVIVEVCYGEKCTKFGCNDIESIVERVVTIMEGVRLQKLEDIHKKAEDSLDTMIKNQSTYLDLLRSILVYSDDNNHNYKSYNRGSCTPYDLISKISYLEDLQQKCEDLISTHLEYRPDSDIVKSLEEEFDKLKTTN